MSTCSILQMLLGLKTTLMHFSFLNLVKSIDLTVCLSCKSLPLTTKAIGNSREDQH